jgi:hypothetical protein
MSARQTYSGCQRLLQAYERKINTQKLNTAVWQTRIYKEKSKAIAEITLQVQLLKVPACMYNKVQSIN